MRWVALLLLIANAALAGWQWAGTPGWSAQFAGPPPDIGELRLLGEGNAAQVAAGGACFTLGPFNDPANAEAAHARLAQAGMRPRQRSTAEEEASGYQVLLPPFPSAEAALAAARELARKGIEDYYIIVSEAELRNAVSVGLFEERRFAERHIGELERLGFEPELRVRTRSRTRYWQDFRDPDGRVTAEFVGSLNADQPLQRLERACAGLS